MPTYQSKISLVDSEGRTIVNDVECQFIEKTPSTDALGETRGSFTLVGSDRYAVDLGQYTIHLEDGRSGAVLVSTIESGVVENIDFVVSGELK